MKNFTETILIVDDTETNIDILLELLGDKYDVVVALNAQSALEIVQENDIDLILLDIMMPNMDGYELCLILKEQEFTKDIPVIFLTAKDDEESIEKAYKVGGIDYITKPFKPVELLARINTQLKVKELIDHLNFISSYDEMTGIYNRRKFFELGEAKFSQGLDDLYCVMIDIDKFKHINDTYGHPTGDKVIKLVTKSIAEHIDSKAIFGRLGGEEFTILCTHSSKKEVVSHIEKIRENIEKLEILSDSGEVIKFTISEGVACADKDTKSLDELLKKADVALYEAKGLGRNRVIFR
ncbi:MAG: diguanylate cyclase response regulator [Sulfurimonas sp. RIFOXYD12_FULL_33_39]|uniref:diguanylate cyclase n=1 Tax=unclassified Sulfurimonas TaxID=2623549 RepID=UPI0008D4CB98|nr:MULTISPECIES: diguanylate cyclase [unclassified Sulfurimonas]OHE07380.1 MAG: diguanylate cyclase response regulator [Sulfurimonas sp. RIFCSPLOWO2_12_FULL_34_6]OHE08850.1 MAG: diguanylate cyclase response regulator [Sulfurimonas sp. RIFOXYD12_FULL_33_39]OHE14160.1 MAG: diguanylate cyclase response regulator [Sulfurimonas sp. RIFOXYD2_FULL_34_21]DAB28015.1 MAG TPA: diguanylate cyclase response regulator [Sulfurimonas sp. UBA10385]